MASRDCTVCRADSRYVVGQSVAAREGSLVAEELVRAAIDRNGVAPHTVRIGHLCDLQTGRQTPARSRCNPPDVFSATLPTGAG